jgi:hypothetical protein
MIKNTTQVSPLLINLVREIQLPTDREEYQDYLQVARSLA